MPLFEYRCQGCRRRFTLLVGVVAGTRPLECPHCRGTELRKLISRFAIARSEESLLEGAADPVSLGDPDDPRAVADWMRRVSREMGEDLGDDFDSLVEEAVREEMDGSAASDHVSDPGSDVGAESGAGIPAAAEGGA